MFSAGSNKKKTEPTESPKEKESEKKTEPIPEHSTKKVAKINMLQKIHYGLLIPSCEVFNVWYRIVKCVQVNTRTTHIFRGKQILWEHWY